MLDLCLSLLSLAGVAALSRGRRWGWWLASAGSLGYCYYAWVLALPGQSLLNAIYLVTQLWGGWRWGSEPRFQGRPHRRWLLLIPMLGLALQQHMAPLDAWLTAASLILQWLTSLGVAQVWRYWVVVDLATAFLYAGQRAPFTAVLYLVLAGVAEQAHRYWRNPARMAGSQESTEKERGYASQ
jgi:nicotinamide mononucleotide transporter